MGGLGRKRGWPEVRFPRGRGGGGGELVGEEVPGEEEGQAWA
jgi:hypothetical protein